MIRCIDVSIWRKPVTPPPTTFQQVLKKKPGKEITLTKWENTTSKKILKRIIYLFTSHPCEESLFASLHLKYTSKRQEPENSPIVAGPDNARGEPPPQTPTSAAPGQPRNPTPQSNNDGRTTNTIWKPDKQHPRSHYPPHTIRRWRQLKTTN